MRLEDLKFNLTNFLEGDLKEETKTMLKNFGFIPREEAQAARQAKAASEAAQAAKMLIDVADTHPTFKAEAEAPTAKINPLIADARKRAEAASTNCVDVTNETILKVRG